MSDSHWEYQFKRSDLESPAARAIWDKMRSEHYVTPKDKAVLWSGLVGKRAIESDKDLALAFKDAGLRPISMTDGGRELAKAIKAANQPGSKDPISKEDARILWNRASKFYAQEASGGVKVLCPDAWSSRATLADVEIPTALRNEKIGTLEGVPRRELLGRYEEGKHTALKERGLLAGGPAERGHAEAPRSYGAERVLKALRVANIYQAPKAQREALNEAARRVAQERQQRVRP